MKPTSRRTLSLQRTTLRNLSNSEMAEVEGGNIRTTIIRTVLACPQPTTTIRTTTIGPSAVDGCPSQWGCTTNTSIDTSVINPGGGF